MHVVAWHRFFSSFKSESTIFHAMHNSYHNENNRREIKFYDPLLETICEANRYLHEHDNK